MKSLIARCVCGKSPSLRKHEDEERYRYRCLCGISGPWSADGTPLDEICLVARQGWNRLIDADRPSTVSDLGESSAMAPDADLEVEAAALQIFAAAWPNDRNDPSLIETEIRNAFEAAENFIAYRNARRIQRKSK